MALAQIAEVRRLKLVGRSARLGARPLEQLTTLPDSWPANALTTDQLAEQLTGRRANDGIHLWDVYSPSVPRDVPLEDIAPRGPTRQIFAQFEAGNVEGATAVAAVLATFSFFLFLILFRYAGATRGREA